MSDIDPDELEIEVVEPDDDDEEDDDDGEEDGREEAGPEA